MPVSSWGNIAQHPVLEKKFKNGQDVDLWQEENNVLRLANEQGGRSCLFAFNVPTGECRGEEEIYPSISMQPLFNEDGSPQMSEMLGVQVWGFPKGYVSPEPAIAALLPEEILIRQTISRKSSTVHNFWDALTM